METKLKKAHEDLLGLVIVRNVVDSRADQFLVKLFITNAQKIQIS